MTMASPKVRVKFHVATGRTGHREVREAPAAVSENAVPGRIPRVSRLMALAIRFEHLIREGIVRDQADLARLSLVSRARLTQIMDLLTLASDIQEAILCLPPIIRGRDPVTERDLRSLVAIPDWRHQRSTWTTICLAVGVDLTPEASHSPQCPRHSANDLRHE